MQLSVRINCVKRIVFKKTKKLKILRNTQWTQIRVIKGSMCFEVDIFQAALALNRAQLSDRQPVHSSTGRIASFQTAIDCNGHFNTASFGVVLCANLATKKLERTGSKS